MHVPDALLVYKATYTLQLQLFIIGFGRNLSPATAVYFAYNKGHYNRLCMNNCTRTGTNRPSGAVLCDVRPPDSSGAFTATPFGDVDGPWRASKARAKHSFAGLQATRTENGPTTPPTRYLKGSEALPLFAMHTPVAQLPHQELLDPSILIRLPHEPNAGNPDRNALLARKKLAPGAI